MATYSNSNYGNDLDRLNCSFYNKIGACRHGDRCSRKHKKPTYSTVVMCPNMYRNPAYENMKYEELQEKEKGTTEKNNEHERDHSTPDPERQRVPDEAEKQFRAKYPSPDQWVKNNLTAEEVQKQFDDFFKDVFIELSLKFGVIEDIVVTENFNHLNGNVYIKFRNETSADLCVKGLNSRWYDRKPVFAELCPVYNFDDAVCGSYNDTGNCSRSVNCNFWHIKKTSSGLRRELFSGQRKYYKEKGL